MSAEGHHVTSLHGAKDAAERDKVIDEFRDGKSKVLITTNVMARGIDILQVNMVVNYDIPYTSDNKPDVETYLHRIGTWSFEVRNVPDCLTFILGRTGRFGRQGISVNFVHDRKTFEDMAVFQTTLGRPIVRIPADEYDIMERVSVLCHSVTQNLICFVGVEEGHERRKMINELC